jgi:ABC-type sugar transport system permease subunit
MRVEAGGGRARAVGAPASRPPRATVAARSGEGAYPWLWILPALALVLLFTLYPVAHTLWTSLHRVMILLPGEPFIGLANYRAVLESAFFAPALLNSLWFTATAAPLIVLLGLGVAHLLLADFRGRFLVRSVVILPWALPGAISAVLWIWIFHPSWGILNLVLYELGLIERYIPWLTDPGLVRVSVVVAHVWTQFPFAAVLLMAALTAIDPQLYEAAKIDGAGRWQRFRFVTFPQIKAMVVVLLVYAALVAFTSYDLVYAMTGGGPGTATTLLSFQIWKESFSMYNFGNGAALAFITVLISLGFIFAIVRALPSDLFGDADA